MSQFYPVGSNMNVSKALMASRRAIIGEREMFQERSSDQLGRKMPLIIGSSRPVEMNTLHKERQNEFSKFQRAMATVYRAALSDIDGTLTGNDGIVKEKILRSVAKMLNNDIYVGLISGRVEKTKEENRGLGSHDMEEVFVNIRAALQDSDKLDHLIGYEENGARGFNGFRANDPRRKDFELGFARVPLDTQREVFSLINSRFSKEVDRPEFKTFGMAIWIKEEFKMYEPFRKELLDAINEIFLQNSLDLDVVRTRNTMDIIAKGVEKGKALDHMFETFNIPKELIATLGDYGQPGGNDRSMLERAGGFCVGHYWSPSSQQVSMRKVRYSKGPNASFWLLNNLTFAS